MNARIKDLLSNSRSHGWVLEPQAKEILKLYGLPVAQHLVAHSRQQVTQLAQQIGYPLVAKIISPHVIHKSDVDGVVVGITESNHLAEVYQRFEKVDGFEGMLLEKQIKGTEVIVGSKQDIQFQTVVLVGIGGTAVEIYHDVALRMAPISAQEARQALSVLKGKALLQGFRGSNPVNLDSLCNLIEQFSNLAHLLLDEVESIDLNPVICNAEGAWIADARMILHK